MSDETTVAPEATETEAAPEASTEEVTAADTTAATAAAPRPAANAAPATPAPADGKDYTPEELVQALEASFRDFGDGDIVEGDVVKIDRDEVLLDIGYKSEGVIPSKELSIRHDVDPNEVVKVGDHIEALVLQKEDKEGRLILSKKRAQYERAWGRIEEVMNSGQTIKGPVIEVVKGGLILDIGLRGFLPASLVDLRRVRDLHPFVGTELEAKIIELDRNRNNVVLSRRAFLEESQSEGRKKFLEGLQKGERRKGTVSSIVNFGAFVDLGGVDGLVHVSELSWKHVDHPQEVVTVGQEVEVEVLDVDLERERVSLSLKATQEDPWKEFERTSQAGAIITGQVTKLVPFGAFVRVAQGIEGLVHISEISHEHVDTPESVLSVGDEVQVKVIDVDVSRRRVSLSMRQVSAPPPREPEIKAEPEQRREPTPEMVSTIQIPDDILAAVAEADAARATEPEPAAPAPAEPEVAESEVDTTEDAVAEAVEEAVETVVAETAVEAAIEETRVEEAVDVAVAEAAIDDAIVAEAEGDTATAEADVAEAEEVVEAAEEATDEEVSLEAILEDLKRREGRSD
ncbi:MAG TPA: 30S ribosomal protein S1 [Actinomycetota bacterium]|nr:30S ribosomal protein S1 [Actinomycetota bacterium]